MVLGAGVRVKAALHDFGDRPCTDSVLVLCCDNGINRGHVALFCAYVDTVNDCRVSVGANVRLPSVTGRVQVLV